MDWWVRKEAIRLLFSDQRSNGWPSTTIPHASPPRKRQQVGIALASLKREFRLGETLASTLVGLATRIATKVTAYTTYAFVVNRLLGRPQGCIKELWA